MGCLTAVSTVLSYVAQRREAALSATVWGCSFGLRCCAAERGVATYNLALRDPERLL